LCDVLAVLVCDCSTNGLLLDKVAHHLSRVLEPGLVDGLADLVLDAGGDAAVEAAHLTPVVAIEIELSG